LEGISKIVLSYLSRGLGISDHKELGLLAKILASQYVNGILAASYFEELHGNTPA